MVLDGPRVVVTGGTGSLGKRLVHRLLAGEMGEVGHVVVFSRDEAKQHAMRLESAQMAVATDEVIYGRLKERLRFVVGDVRDYRAVLGVLRGADAVIHAAALKQVPTCEYNVIEAIQTNVLGAANIVWAIRDHGLPVAVVLGVSTDKAVKPVNVYGITKAAMERILLQANLVAPNTRFCAVRYGNVLASRGSVVPVFRDQICRGGPVTVTSQEMTRFFFTIDDAVSVVFAAIKGARAGETYVPRLPSVRMLDLARAMIGRRPIEIEYTGIRPGEKVHEVLVSEEELPRTVSHRGHYVIRPILPELRGDVMEPPALVSEFSSRDNPLDPNDVWRLLDDAGLLLQEQEL